MSIETKLQAALDCIEKQLNDGGFVVERTPVIRDANGNLRCLADLKAEYDCGGLFKNTLLFKCAKRDSDLVRAKDEMCQAALTYKNKSAMPVAISCTLIVEDRADYSEKSLSALKDCCVNYTFADDICRNVMAGMQNG